MSKKILSVVGWGFAGLVVALGLTAGAFALAGQELDEPLEPPVFPESTQPIDDPTPSDDVSRSPRSERSDTPSPSVDDHGGDSDGSDDSGSEDGDDSGSGSDDSGSGSDNSGSGSDNSGSGSDNSGSGSGDDHDDD